MRYIADLHIHSHYSRATSKASNLHGLAAWAAVKGIGVVATGDFTHPGWFAHLQECLEPAEPGFFRLKDDQARDVGCLLPAGLRPANDPGSIRFVLSAEISSIYKRGGKVRKVHNLLYVPDMASVRRMNATLATLGNISADGRPILGLDSRDLLEILLEKTEQGFLVPAHIWTPWFSLFGSKSGFDSIDECFGDLSHHVFALETGLSSDPEMNRLISALDRFTLISNSDCHSPAKLGREANIFTTGFDFFSLRAALQAPVDAHGQQVFAATVEFYPEEGKYHCDGHRKCQVCLEPQETRAVSGLCPTCGKPLTIGVLHRVMELADREKPISPPGSPQVYSQIPLQEIVAELLDCGPTSKKVVEGYIRLINVFGSEFTLLLETPVEDIRAQGFGLLAEAVERVRANRVIRRAGYDGEFGVITVFSEGERARLCGQGSLFGTGTRPEKRSKAQPRTLFVPNAGDPPVRAAQPVSKALNREQQQVVASDSALLLVQAGPGTGKTHTLVSRVQRIAASGTTPCTVITFTNKAATEVRERLQRDGAMDSAPVMVATFHGYCLAQLRRCAPQLQVAGPEQRVAIIEELQPDWSSREWESCCRQLTGAFSQPEFDGIDVVLHRYLQTLETRSLIDIDAVVPRTVDLLRQGGTLAEEVRAATGHLFVDEFQDVNEAQYNLVALLSQTSTVFAIGDPDQAIYGFRGSDPRWFHAFNRELHPEVHHLICNYRSGTCILRSAEQLIANNPHPLPMVAMEACAGTPGAMYLQRCANPEREAGFIADHIEHHLGGTSHRSLERIDHTGMAAVSFRDIAILYRTSVQAEAIGTVLTGRGIPFQVVDLEAYYTKGDCRLLYYWVLMLAGMAQDAHLLHLLSREPGMDRRSLDLVGARLRRIRSEAGALQPIGHWLEDVDLVNFNDFRLFAVQLHIRAASQPVAATLQVIIDRYRMAADHPDSKRLVELALTFDQSLMDFAAHLLRYSDSVIYDPRAEAVTLSTLHAAKGLEFPLVFIAGLEEGLLPLRQRQPVAKNDQGHVEEERRLLYVGLTRTCSTLYLTWCAERSRYGRPPEPCQPSRFLQELPAGSFTVPPVIASAKVRKPSPLQLSLFS